MEHILCGHFKFNIVGLFDLMAVVDELKLKTTIKGTITQMVRAKISLSFSGGHLT